MAVIRAKHYDETVAKMRMDMIIQSMAIGLKEVPRDRITHENGTARFEFMQAANNEYHNVRNGKLYGHIGAVAEALLSLLDTPPTSEERFAVIDTATLVEMIRHTSDHPRFQAKAKEEVLRRMGVNS